MTESQREFESQRQQLLEINGAYLAQRERICLCSRFGDEGPSPSIMLYKKLPRIWRIEKEVAIERKLQKKTTTKIGRTSTQQDQESRTVSLLSDQRRRLQERLESIEDSKIFYDLDSPSSYDNITFLIKLLFLRVQLSLAARLECCEIHETIWVFLETFLIVNMLNEILMKCSIIQEIWQHHRESLMMSRILRTEGIENSGSEEPLQSILLPCFSVRARRKSQDDK